jgi:hypothetical protein
MTPIGGPTLSSSGEDPADPDAAFRIWVNRSRGRMLKHKGAVIKAGRDVKKTVELVHYGSQTDGKVRNRTLRFRNHDVRGGKTVDFDDEKASKNAWFCENDEIEKLLAFLHNDVAHTGRYRVVVDVDSPGAALLELLGSDEIDPQSLVDALVPARQCRAYCFTHGRQRPRDVCCAVGRAQPSP